MDTTVSTFVFISGWWPREKKTILIGIGEQRKSETNTYVLIHLRMTQEKG
jgi:hypothetical protein